MNRQTLPQIQRGRPRSNPNHTPLHLRSSFSRDQTFQQQQGQAFGSQFCQSSNSNPKAFERSERQDAHSQAQTLHPTTTTSANQITISISSSSSTNHLPPQSRRSNERGSPQDKHSLYDEPDIRYSASPSPTRQSRNQTSDHQRPITRQMDTRALAEEKCVNERGDELAALFHQYGQDGKKRGREEMERDQLRDYRRGDSRDEVRSRRTYLTAEEDPWNDNQSLKRTRDNTYRDETRSERTSRREPSAHRNESERSSHRNHGIGQYSMEAPSELRSHRQESDRQENYTQENHRHESHGQERNTLESRTQEHGMQESHREDSYRHQSGTQDNHMEESHKEDYYRHQSGTQENLREESHRQDSYRKESDRQDSGRHESHLQQTHTQENRHSEYEMPKAEAEPFFVSHHLSRPPRPRRQDTRKYRYEDQRSTTERQSVRGRSQSRGQRNKSPSPKRQRRQHRQQSPPRRSRRKDSYSDYDSDSSSDYSSESDDSHGRGRTHRDSRHSETRRRSRSRAKDDHNSSYERESRYKESHRGPGRYRESTVAPHRRTEIRGHDVYRPSKEPDQPYVASQSDPRRATSNQNRNAKRRALKRLRQAEEHFTQGRQIALEERISASRQQQRAAEKGHVSMEPIPGKNTFERDNRRSHSGRIQSRELPKQDAEYKEFRASVTNPRRRGPVSRPSFHSKRIRPLYSPSRALRASLSGSNRTEPTRILPLLDVLSPKHEAKEEYYEEPPFDLTRPAPIARPVILAPDDFSLIAAHIRTTNFRTADAIQRLRPLITSYNKEQQAIELENLDFCFIHVKNAMRRLVAQRHMVKGTPTDTDRKCVEADERGLQALLEMNDKLVEAAGKRRREDRDWRRFRGDIENIVDTVGEERRKAGGFTKGE